MHPRVSVYVRVPIASEVQGLQGTGAGLMWAVSLWASGSARLTYDVTRSVTPDPAGATVDATDRTVRLDVLDPGVRAVRLRLELWEGDVPLGTSFTTVFLGGDAHTDTTVVTLPRYKPGVQMTATTAVTLSPHTAAAVSVLVCGSGDGHPVALAPCEVAFVETRVYRGSARIPSAPPVPLCPLDFQLPGRSEVCVIGLDFLPRSSVTR